MEQIDILRYAVDVLDQLGIPYLVVGSFASIAYGEARFTQDIDIVVKIEEQHITAFVEAFPSPEFYLSQLALKDAISSSTQFNVIHPASGMKIDFIVSLDDRWSKVRNARGRLIRLLPERDVMLAAPEDVIIGKLWYFSQGGGDRHLRDIAGILRVSGAGVDRAEIERWAKEMGFLDIWLQIIAKTDTAAQPSEPGGT